MLIEHGLSFPILLVIILPSALGELYFQPKPRAKVSVKVKDSVTLECGASGNLHTLRFYWEFRGKNGNKTELRSHDKSHRRHMPNQLAGDLLISWAIAGEDDGEYQCVAMEIDPSNEVTNAIRSPRTVLEVLYLIGPLQIETQGKLQRGSKFYLQCQLTAALPEPTYYWFRNGERIYNQLSPGSRLSLLVNSDIFGSYVCVAESQAGVLYSQTQTVYAREPNYPRLRENRQTNRVALVGKSISLDCPFEVDNSLRWKWSRRRFNGDLSVNRPEDQLTSASKSISLLSNGTLVVERVEADSAGDYICTVESTANNVTAIAFSTFLRLAELGHFEKLPFSSATQRKSNVGTEGMPLMGNRTTAEKSATLDVICNPPHGSPPPKVRWTFSQGGESRVVPGRRLTLTIVNNSSQGFYACHASNAAGSQTAYLAVIVPWRPRLKVAPKLIAGALPPFAGSTVGLQCIGEWNPNATTVTWTMGRDGVGVLVSSNSIISGHNGEYLQLNHLSRKDSGDYRCRASSPSFPLQESPTIRIAVRTKLDFDPKPPQETVLTANSEKEGIGCKAKSENDAHEIAWMKVYANSTATKLIRAPFPKGVEVDEDNTLVFKNIKLSQAGKYVCAAAPEKVSPFSQSTDVIRAFVEVKVFKPPTFTVQPQHTDAKYGNTVSLHCQAVGDPKPSIMWHRVHKDENLQSKNKKKAVTSIKNDDGNGRYRVLDNGTLVIRDFQADDLGTYMCMAGNRAAISSSEARLSLADEAEGMTKTVIIAVGCAGAYLVLVLALTIYCSFRMIRQNRQKNSSSANGPSPGQQPAMQLKHASVAQPLLPRALPASSTGGLNGFAVQGDGGAHLAIPESQNGCVIRGSSEAFGNSASGSRRFPSISTTGGPHSGPQTVSSGTNQHHRKHRSTGSSGANGQICAPVPIVHPSSNDREQGTFSSSSQSVVSASAGSSYTDKDSSTKQAGYYFPRDRLQIVSNLGKCQYGSIHLAKACSLGGTELLVYVKSLNPRTADKSKFQHEVELFRKCNHRHVASLVGLSQDAEPRLLMLEHCDWGDLKRFLLTLPGRGDSACVINGNNPERLVAFAFQIASGMEHIADKRLVHRDLAARNVMLRADMTVKISYIAACLDGPYANEYFTYAGQIIPLRWLPTEVVLDSDYTSKSDVYSFGCTLFEIFTLCSRLPFSNLLDLDLLASHKSRKPPSLSLGMNETNRYSQIQNMINRCCLAEARKRPSFSDISSWLRDGLRSPSANVSPQSNLVI